MNSAERNAQARLGCLHYAVLKRDCADVRYQLRHGADVTAKNQDGDTALHMLRYPRKWIASRDAALTVQKWKEECARLDNEIIQELSSANRRCFHVRDAAGNTPLMSCINAPDDKNDVHHVVLTLMEKELVASFDDYDLKVNFDILNNENESALDLAFANERGDAMKAICIYHFERGLAVSKAHVHIHLTIGKYKSVKATPVAHFNIPFELPHASKIYCSRILISYTMTKLDKLRYG